MPGKGCYQLFDRATRSIIMSHDIIFDEETGHQLLITIEEADNLLANEALPPLSITMPSLLIPCQPVAPWICGDEPLHQAAQDTESDQDTNGTGTSEAVLPDAEGPLHPEQEGMA